MKDTAIYEEIYYLKAIAIIGVIIQHMHPPLINGVFSHFLKNIFARFHMEAFMFASGFLFGISRVEISSFTDYFAFVAKKFKRIIVPYFVLSGIILLMKYSVQQYVTLISPVTYDFWKHLLFNPVAGFATFLWFLYILFFVFLIFPILHKIVYNSKVLFLFVFIMNLIYIPRFDYFNHYLLRWGLLFFCSGYLYSRCKFENIKAHTLHIFLLLTALIVLLTTQKALIVEQLQTFIGYQPADNLIKYLVALQGTFAFYYLSVLLEKHKNPLSHILKYIGIYSASIYLLHTIAMASVRIVFIELFRINESFHSLISILVFIAGVMLPIYITKHIIYKFNMLPPLILGVNKPS